MNNVMIRRIRADDAARLRKIRLAALVDSPGAFSTNYAEAVAYGDELWSERAEMGAAGRDLATFFAESPAGRLVGLVAGLAHDDRAGVVELVSMWVEPAARGTGAAKALVEAVIEWASVGSATRVELWVMQDNKQAEEFYQRVGFVRVKAHKTMESDPCREEIRMAMDL